MGDSLSSIVRMETLKDLERPGMARSRRGLWSGLNMADAGMEWGQSGKSGV